MNTLKKMTVAVALALAAGGALAQDKPAAAPAEPGKIRFNIQSAFPRPIPISGSALLGLVDKLQKASGGTIDARFVDPGGIVPPLQILDGVQNGAADAGWSVGGYWTGKDTAFNFYSAIPFGPDNTEYIAWMYQGGGLELMRELYGQYNIHPIPCGMTTPEAGGWFRKEIKSVADLKGLRMRFFGIGGKALEKLGVTTQTIAAGDIYPSLERGTIDATEFSSPAIDLNFGFQRVAKFYYWPGWHQQASFLELLINKKKWEEFTPQQRTIIELACGDNVRDTIAVGEAAQYKALAEMQAKGMTLRRFPKPVIDAIQKAWNEVAAEEAAKNPNFRKANDSFTKFRKDYAVWRQVSNLR